MPKYTEYFGNQKVPRGVRNHNPGNIRWGDPWQGLLPKAKRTDTAFCQFSEPAYGIRALAATLTTYFDKRKAGDGSRIDTVEKIITRWAPPVENDTTSYVNQVAKNVGVGPDDKIDLHDFETMRAVVESIIRHENGKGDYATLNTWYPDEVINEGLRRAGLTPPVKTVAAVPVTKTTVAAGSTALLGAGQLLEVSQPVIDAIRTSQDNLTSGQWARVIFGFATIGIGCWLAYIQYRKQKAGQAV